MTTFWSVQNRGDGYAPLRLLIQNNSDKTIYYNFNGIKSPDGEQLKPYGTQTSVLSLYQRQRAGISSTTDAEKLSTAMITKTPWFGVLKMAYYLTSMTIKAVGEKATNDAMSVEGYVTNYRAGFVKARTNLFVELGAMRVDGSLNNKGWPETADKNNFTDSYMGPVTLADADSASPEEIQAAVRQAGVGIKFWGEKRGFFQALKGKMFSTFLNLASLPGAPGLNVDEDTELAHSGRAGTLAYRIDGGGLDDPRSDFIHILVNNTW